MSAAAPAFLNLVMASIAGALIGWAGNYYVQERIHRRLARADELRRAFYEYLQLTADYWFSTGTDLEKRQSLEGRMFVAWRIISSEYSLLAKTNCRIRRSYVHTQSLRTDLLDAATGGCFQQVEWTRDPDRVRSAARAVTEIVKSFS